MYGAGGGYFDKLLGGGKTRVLGIRQERNPIFPGISPEPITPNLGALSRKKILIPFSVNPPGSSGLIN